MDNKLKSANWDNYSDDSIDLMYNQGQEQLGNTTQSLREITNKSYTVFAVFYAPLVYAIVKLTSDYHANIPYYILIIGMLISILIIIYNLLPSKDMRSTGTSPENFIHEYFEERKETQDRDYKISLIKGISEGIVINVDENKFRVKLFIASALCSVTTIIIHIIVYISFI